MDEKNSKCKIIPNNLTIIYLGTFNVFNIYIQILGLELGYYFCSKQMHVVIKFQLQYCYLYMWLKKYMELDNLGCILTKICTTLNCKRWLNVKMSLRIKLANFFIWKEMIGIRNPHLCTPFLYQRDMTTSFVGVSKWNFEIIGISKIQWFENNELSLM